MALFTCRFHCNALATHNPGAIDWITFVGSGEPTLHIGLGWLIAKVKAITDIPVAVITNGALLYLPEVRRDLLPADAVRPTLDAGSADLYRRVNRPHSETTFNRFENDVLFYVEGVRRGDTLYVFEVPEYAAAEADRILTTEHGLLIHRLENGQQVYSG